MSEKDDEQLKAMARAFIIASGGVTDRHAPRRTSPLLLVWLALSIILNLTSLASLVDGLVVWVGFLANIVETYRAVIREPVLAVLAIVWPFDAPPPEWAADCVAAYAGLLSTCSVMMVIELRANDTLVKTLFEARSPVTSGLLVLLYPVLLLAGPFDRHPFIKAWSRRYYRYLAASSLLMIVLLFVNHQLA